MRFFIFLYFCLFSYISEGQYVTAIYDACCPLPRVINVAGGTGDGYVSNATFIGVVLSLILNNGNPPILVDIVPQAESGTYFNLVTDNVRLGTKPFLEDVWLYATPVFDFRVFREETNTFLGEYYLLLDDDSFVFPGPNSWRSGAYWEQSIGIIPPIVLPEHLFVGVEGEFGKKLHGVMRGIAPFSATQYEERLIEVDQTAGHVFIKSQGDNTDFNTATATSWTSNNIRNNVPSNGKYEIYSSIGGLLYFKVDGADGHTSAPYTMSVGIEQTPPAGYSMIIEDDLYMITTDNAIIMKSPDGSCWTVKVDNAGAVNTVNIICP